MLHMTLAIAVGVGGAAQARINGELALRLDSWLGAALISFTCGLLFLTSLIIFVPGMRSGFRQLPASLKDGRLRLWEFLGGTIGALGVLVQTVTVPVLGVGLFVVVGVAGLTIFSLAVDRAGFGSTHRRHVTPARGFAAALTIGAVALGVTDKLTSANFSLLMVLFVFGVNGLRAVQGGINSRVATEVGSQLTAAWMNFAVGATGLAILYLLWRGAAARSMPFTPESWWLYLGGVLGVAFIVVATGAIAHIGVLLFSLCTVMGSVVGGIVMDILFPFAPTGASLMLILSGVLTICAVLLGASNAFVAGSPGNGRGRMPVVP